MAAGQNHVTKARAGLILPGLAAFAALTLLASIRMPRALWGLSAPADFPLWVGLAAALLVIWGWSAERWIERSFEKLSRFLLAPALVALVVMIACWLGRIRLHWLGDQAIWLRSFNTDTYHVLEPASFALVRTSSNLVASRVPGQGAFIISVLFGGLFVLLAWLLAGELERASAGRRAWLWGMMVFTPQLLFFRGYVESYPYLLVALMALAWLLLRALRGERMLWIWPLTLVAASAHVIGIGALPAVIYAGWQRQRTRWGVLLGALLIGASVAIWVIIKHSQMPGHLGSMRLAFAIFDLSSQGWDRFLSPRHVLGLANELLLLGGPLLFVAPGLPWRTWSKSADSKCLILLIAPGLAGLLLVRPLLGPMRDWDLFAAYLYFLTPALATLWLARAPGPALPRYSSLLLVLAFVHSMFWGSVDMDVDRGLRRGARIYGEGSDVAPEARGRAAEDFAIVERSRGNEPGAESWYEAATYAMPNHWRYQFNLGSMAQSLGHLDKATEAFERAVALNPNVGAPYAALGSLYLRENRIREAITAYDLGLRHAGPDFGLYYGKGASWAMLGDYTQAAGALDSALVVKPQNAAALLYRGVVALKQGSAKEAISFLKRSLRADPNQEGWTYLVEAAVVAGDSVLAQAARARSPLALDIGR
jgi:tetratricopeptide (TPR) repeat protein